LASVENAWLGGADGRVGSGIAALTASISPSARDRVSHTLRKAVKAADQLPPSLADASPAELRNAYRNTRKLTRELDTEIATLLSVAIDLTDVDGDS